MQSSGKALIGQNSICDYTKHMSQGNPSRKIVIVEDNTDLASIYQTQLEAAGYHCLIAHDGIAALYNIQTELPQLVLLDLMVPAIAGDEVLKRMRATEWGKNIPVLIISNLNEDDAPTGLRDLGIVGYLVKANLASEQLLQVVNAIVGPTSGNAG
jgi:DNA-binding response OmpR family regulator